MFVGCIPYSCKTIFSMWIPVGGIAELDRNFRTVSTTILERGRLLLQRLRRGANFCFPSDRNLTWNLMRSVKALEPPEKSKFPSSNYQCQIFWTCLWFLVFVVVSFGLIYKPYQMCQCGNISRPR